MSSMDAIPIIHVKAAVLAGFRWFLRPLLNQWQRSLELPVLADIGFSCGQACVLQLIHNRISRATKITLHSCVW